MIVLQLFFVTLVVKKCQSELVQVFHPFHPVSAPLAPICPLPRHQLKPLATQSILENNAALEKSKHNLKFLLPFLDMELQSNRSLHVMQEVHRQQIYILHGHELYQLFINRQEKRLSLVGVLEGSARHVEPLAAEIIYWHGNFILVVSLDEYLEVYQLAEDVLVQRAEVVKDPARAHEPAPIFETIQELTLTGRFQKFIIFSPAEERIMIAAAVNLTELYGKLRIFEWVNSYFNPIEEITVPPLHVISVIGHKTKYLVTGRSIPHQTTTILTVYEISPPAFNLLPKQTLTVESRVVHMFTYHHRNMIVACSSDQEKCNSFRQMTDGQFSIYRHRTSKEFAFDLMSSSSRFVSATRQNQVMIFTNHRLDCYGSFISDQINVTAIMAYQNAFKENYVLLVYKRPFNALLRIVELDINSPTGGNHSEPEETLLGTQHQHLFESTVGQLRSLLLKRKLAMDVFRKISFILRSELKDLEVSERIVLHEGNVGIIKVVGQYLRSPKQILQDIESFRQNMSQRSKRATNQGHPNISLEVTNPVKVLRMSVENLIYEGDVMEGFSLSHTNLQEKILTIRPKVTTHNLNSTQIILPYNMRDTRQVTTPDVLFDLTPSVRVRHLKVDFINGVAWNAFYDSLFLKNRDKLVQGRLVLQAPVNVTNLTTKILNGLVVSNLFNLIQPQVIHSDLVISRFSVQDLKANTVNGLIFEEDIAFSGHDTVIESPVIIYHLNISGDLFLANNTKVERLAVSPDEIEFKQFYTNKIIVNGSLIVNNLRRLNNETKIILGDQEFNEEEIKRNYLLGEQPQNFSFPVTFEEAKVTAPYLESSYLNDHKTEEHMLVNKVNASTPFLVIFMAANVQGDVISRDYKSKLAEIKENIIRPGDKVNMTGTKIFEAPLEVNNVMALTLNQLPVEALVFKKLLKDNKTIKFKDSKDFNSIKVINPTIIEQGLQASYLNNLPLDILLTDDHYKDYLRVPYLVNATNIVFHKINGIPFDDIFTKLDIEDDHVILHKDVIVEGSIQFLEALQLQYLNDIPWNEYVDGLVRFNEKNAIVEGDVIFKGDLTITKELQTPEINGFNLEVILQNVLMKSKPQLITGFYHFDRMSGTNIDVKEINGVNVSEFVDLTQNVTEIEGDMIVEKLNVRGNLQGNLHECENLFAAKEKVKQLPTKPWKNLYVLRNANWPADVGNNIQQELLNYFYKHAVKANQDQTITGNVIFSKPFITNMKTRLKLPPNLDISFILQDGLLKNSPVRQTIKGEKVFLKLLCMETLKAKHHLSTKFLNHIDVLRFNQSLYRLTSQQPLQATLKFLKPLIVGHLQVNGLINGLNTSFIFQLMPDSTLPALQLQELYVENDLYIKNIENMNLQYFLDNRLKLTGPALEHFGVLTFEHLVIAKEALMQTINGIPIENMVFKHSPYLQTITGHKTIEHTLELAGPTNVMHINDRDLIELYRNTLMKEQNYQFDNLLIDQVIFEKGLQVARNSNYNLQQRSLADSEHIVDNNRESFLRFLREFKDNFTNPNKNIIYLDYDLNASIKWLDPGEATPNETIFYEMSRISSCEKTFIQVSFQYPNNFYLKNITRTSVTAISNKISAKAQNYCRLQNRKVKSKITISHQKLVKVFGMKRYIESIYILNFDNSPDKLVILHALDLLALKRNEVRIFKINTRNNTIDDWQGLTQNVGEQLKLYTFSKSHILITNGIIDHHPVVAIYHFNYTNQLFEMQQIIEGDYDVVEMIEVPNIAATKQLILSCSKCQRIFIYELNVSQAPGKYEILQIISLKSSVDKLVIFSLNSDCYMLVIAQRDSNLYTIYKYSYIQGWLQSTYGYFPNLHMSIPLTELWDRDDSSIVSQSTGDIPLILLCNLDDCYLVKAIV